MTKNDLALTLKDMGKPEEGAAILRELLMSALARSADHPKTLTYRGNLARAEHEMKHLVEAENLMRKTTRHAFAFTVPRRKTLYSSRTTWRCCCSTSARRLTPNRCSLAW